jgi:hypothetical protein
MVLAAFVLFAACCQAADVGGATNAISARSVTNEHERYLLEAMKVMTSDALEGRGVGTEGLDRASRFLAAQFAQAGLRTNAWKESPYEEFEMRAGMTLGPADHNRLTLVGPAANGATQEQRTVLSLGKDFNPLALGGSGQFQAPLVFAGYGITAPELNYDDYAGLDVKGKAVLVVRKEPQQADPKSKFDGTRMTQHASFLRKVANAVAHGALAVVLINDHFSVASGTPPAEQDRLLGLTEAGGQSVAGKTPVFFATRAAVAPLVKAALGQDLTGWEKQVDAELVPHTTPLKNCRIEAEASLTNRQAKVRNVMGVLDGAGPLTNETLVVGAHYDHLGFITVGGTNRIFRGADDNASGTVTLLGVARLLAARPTPPARRIVFVAFTGEEAGLVGSARYVRETIFPLEKTVAMINLDMVGRLAGERLTVDGSGTAAAFDPLLDELGKKYGFQLTKHRAAGGGSDHASFNARRVPVLQLSTGLHPDYHQPSDDVSKINIQGMRRVAELVADAAWAIAANPQRPVYVTNQTSVAARSGRAYLGIQLDSTAGGQGVSVGGVSENSPAARAGLRTGDVIVKWGDQKLAGAEDLLAAVTKAKPGQQVQLTLTRQGKTITQTVTLGASPQ